MAKYLVKDPESDQSWSFDSIYKLVEHVITYSGESMEDYAIHVMVATLARNVAEGKKYIALHTSTTKCLDMIILSEDQPVIN